MNAPDAATEYQEPWELRQQFKHRPELRMLFSLTKNATKEDVQIASDILKRLKDREMGDEVLCAYFGPSAREKRRQTYRLELQCGKSSQSKFSQLSKN